MTVTLGTGGRPARPPRRLYLPVPGTWGTEDVWWLPGSAWAAHMQALGWDPLVVQAADAFWWSTDVNGTLVRRGHADWKAGGVALRYYFRPPLYVTGPDFVPLDARTLVAHSHGLQVVLYACGAYGLKIDTLISVCSPVRGDMRRVADAARPHIRRWVHLYDPGWADRMQVLGALFDGHWGVSRTHPLADVNLRVRGGHSGVLRDPACFGQWDDILRAASG